VEVDLLRCVSAWEASGTIPAFRLATADHSERLVLPEHLYGREEQVRELLRSFERLVVHGPMEIVLVSGPSGIGKSSLVAELRRATTAPRSLFASGKFDHFARSSIRFPPWTIGRRRAGTNSCVMRWASTGSSSSIWFPELENLIGPQPAVGRALATDALRQFDATFTSFIKVFATSAHPLALFLDDLQWLDQATLNFLERLIETGGAPHLLLVGAYRDNEINEGHPLQSLITAIRGSGIGLTELALGLSPLKVSSSSSPKLYLAMLVT
jgi:predicted ATPase